MTIRNVTLNPGLRRLLGSVTATVALAGTLVAGSCIPSMANETPSDATDSNMLNLAMFNNEYVIQNFTNKTLTRQGTWVQIPGQYIDIKGRLITSSEGFTVEPPVEIPPAQDPDHPTTVSFEVPAQVFEGYTQDNTKLVYATNEGDTVTIRANVGRYFSFGFPVKKAHFDSSTCIRYKMLSCVPEHSLKQGEKTVFPVKSIG